MESLDFGSPVKKPAIKTATKKAAAKKSATKGKRGRRGNLTDLIVAEIKAAGKKGIHIKDLADKLGTGRGNINAWLYSTGKKVKRLKKVAKATFALK